MEILGVPSAQWPEPEAFGREVGKHEIIPNPTLKLATLDPMPSPWQEEVDEFWSSAFACERDLIRTPGVHVVDGGPGLDEYRGLYLLRIDDACFVYAPRHVRDGVREQVRRLAADDVFTRELARALVDDATLVLGPSRHHYTGADELADVDDAAVRELSDADDELLDTLRRECGWDDWTEGGMPEEPAQRFGIVQRGALMAAGNLTGWRDTFSDIGLVTHPRHRGYGLAGALTHAMARRALQGSDVVRYRALTTNMPSLAVARRAGFEPYGENIAVHLGE
jgi:RimJ/RimL family protein N-acetyltransferase